MEMYECKVVDIHWQQINSEKSESSSAKLNWTYGNILDVNCELWWIVKLGQTVLGNSVCN